MDHFNWTMMLKNTSSPSQPSPSFSTFRNISGNAAPMPFDMVTAVTYGIVFIVGLLGNTLAIYVVVRYTKMKTVTNIYILNLALADELYVLGIPFLGANSALSYWPYGVGFCKVCMAADAMSQFASTCSLMVMSIDRYLAVVHPIRSSKWRKPQVAKVSNVLVWVISFLVMLPVTIYSHVQEDLNTCNITWPEHENELWSVFFILYTTILCFFAPIVVISICHLLILIKVRSAGVKAGLTKRRKSERKVTRMVVVIVLVFLLCWLPFYVTNIVNLIHIIPETKITAAIYSSMVILTYVNSCANPVIYGFLSENFKQSFKKVLCIHRPSGVGTKEQKGGRKMVSQENHSPIYSQNGKLPSIQLIQSEFHKDLNSEALTLKTDLNSQASI